MAEISIPFTNEKHVNGVEMEPSISTPLQQEAKRKRPQNNETDLTRRKKPRKKMYRPKVIGEGRKRKNKGPKTPAKQKQVTPKPRTPKPRPLRKPKTRKLAPKTDYQKNISEKSTKLLEDDNQLNAIVSCRDLVEVAAIEAKEAEKDDQVNAIDSCRDLVLVENELESEKAFAEIAITEEAEEDNSKSTVIQTTASLTERLDGSLCLPQECKRKRSSRRMRTKIERKPYELRNKLLPFFFMKRKRTPTVRRCNLASLLALPVCNELPRNIHKHAVRSKETENFNGNDIAAFVGWQLKRPRNHQASSNCSSRDEDGSTKIEDSAITDVIKEEIEILTEALAQTSLSQPNGRDTSIGTAIIDVNKEETLTKGLAQTSLSQASSKFSDVQSEGGLQKMGNLFHNKRISKYNGQLTKTWLDIKHYLTKSRLKNGRSEKNPPEKSLSIPRNYITGLHNVGNGGNLTRQQDFSLSATPSGDANKLRPTLRMILWNNSEGIRNNHEHIRLTGETRANNKVFLGEETDSLCKRLLVPYAADGRYNDALFRNVSEQKEGADLGLEKQIIPYVRKRGKKTSKQEHNPNSVHGMQGAIVPHPKSLNSTKKKDLGRVYLDPRDITVWKVLFENNSNSDKEKIDDRWWENERGVFRGRINAFNAIMHVILGDRRFSPWKGSVVDSVVGVFLTQNVSDHLSSSAYMSLAATFPLPETENYHGEEIFCIQQPSQRNERLFLCESKWINGSMMETNKATGDPEEAKGLMSADDAISSQDCLGSSVKENLDLTLLSSTDNSVLHPNKSTFEQEPDTSSQNSTSSCGSNQENKTSKSKEQSYLEDRNPNNLNDEKETEISKGKAKKSKTKQEVDWNSLREKWDSMRRRHPVREPRSQDNMDSVDWEAVRSAEPIKIADAIKERGQHNIIAGRIKEFLDRTARIHGCIDLEWLRHAPPKDVKEYLLEIDGLGLKSVECIRLLALQQVAFPVDINVGRIAVRLGWVPLEPLPEEVQMHLLETFPMMDSIQKYLWPRLSMLDQRTLYELHYQLITFGKVFCTKRKPNCNACPLRADCRHYASAYASARLALPGLPEKGIVSTTAPDKSPDKSFQGTPDKSFEGTAQVMNPASILQIDANPFSGARYQTNNCEPIIEEPPSPEPAYDESQLTDIEDLCEYDSDDVPIIRFSSGQFTTSLNCMDDNITGALVPLHTKAASIPMPKLKHIDRLRTEHQAYELPDTHPLLSELERREPNDPCPYLLCIFSPGETVDSFEPPNTRCNYQEMGELCTEGSCSSCNIAREQKAGTVRGTILIPCRTAMRGKFPLNGTYFQVNEVFADDETSKNPIHVPREWIWDLPRRITYFGTSTTTIFRGLAKEDIQYCFQKGFICVRGFNRRTRTPKRLAERLHRATTASIKARANKNENQKQKTNTSNSKSPQEL